LKEEEGERRRRKKETERKTWSAFLCEESLASTIRVLWSLPSESLETKVKGEREKEIKGKITKPPFPSLPPPPSPLTPSTLSKCLPKPVVSEE
jgi:hypothetical protein